MTTIVLVTGGFDPLHSGHIAYFEAAKQLGDELWVGLNSDSWLARKKGRHFMPITERASIVKNLRMVDRVITNFDDSDGSASGAIHKALNVGAEHIVFANGGDRGTDNTPEQTAYKYTPNVEFTFGVGGEDKRNSSSWILKEWQAPKTEREWGHYRELYSGDGFAVKELVIAPGKSLSNQRHFKRSEHWYVLKGECALTTEWDDRVTTSLLTELTSGYAIGQQVWHQASNNTKDLCHILEVQYGEECVEEDIERR